MDEEECRSKKVEFTFTDDAEFPWQAVVEDQMWVIRVNDWPARDLFTLIIDEEEIFDFISRPPNWRFLQIS